VERRFIAGWNALIVWAGRTFLDRTVDVAGNGSGDKTEGWLQLALIVALALWRCSGDFETGLMILAAHRNM